MAAPTATYADSVLLHKNKLVFYLVTMGTTYSSGGHTLDVSTYIPTAVRGAFPISDLAGYRIEYVRASAGAPATGKLKAYYQSSNVLGALTQVSDSKDLSAVQFYLCVMGY